MVNEKVRPIGAGQALQDGVWRRSAWCVGGAQALRGISIKQSVVLTCARSLCFMSVISRRRRTYENSKAMSNGQLRVILALGLAHGYGWPTQDSDR